MHLYAVYETIDRSYWTKLARYNQQEFKKRGVEGKCIEARELIIALPESLYELEMPDILLKSFTDKFKEKYGVECVATLHHNKRMTNFHIHLIFSERQLLVEPVIKTATRNMFYNEHGNHVRTKKEIIDEAGNICKRCKVIKKGEVYEKKLFTSKNTRFKQEDFLDEVKLFYTRMINRNYYKEVQDKNRVYYKYYHLDGTQDVPEEYKEISFVCLRPDGCLELPSTLGIVCRSVSNKLDGFEGFHFHQLRHTYTSNLLSNGAAPKDVQELLGHSDVSTTMNVYAHSTRKAKRDSARLLDKVAGND